jgi:probable rRNA maturation factor
LSIEVSNETNFAIDEVRVLRLAEFALDQMRIHPAAELSIIFVDEKAMEQLHLQWMDEPGATGGA